MRIEKLVIPTPFPVGPINTYLIVDDPLTLVDTGPKTDAAMEDALAGLNMEALASYQENITLGRRLAASLEKSGVSVEKAARLFKLALEQNRPKLKYFIGSDAKMVNFLVKYLPDGFRMGLIKIQLRFKNMR